MTKTQRLINRINEKESFYDIAYICEDFDTFITEISEWGVDICNLYTIVKSVIFGDKGIIPFYIKGLFVDSVHD